MLPKSNLLYIKEISKIESFGHGYQLKCIHGCWPLFFFLGHMEFLLQEHQWKANKDNKISIKYTQYDLKFFIRIKSNKIDM